MTCSKFISVFVGFLVLLVLFFAFLSLFVGNAHSEDIIIYTDNNVYYYPDIEKSDTLILPNDEIINTKDIYEVQRNDQYFETRDDNSLSSSGYDNSIFMGNDYDNKEN